tara:strand:- start:10793 stop:12946 length:2154 start_codon:yes stop_codon:yes gene_type:complete
MGLYGGGAFVKTDGFKIPNFKLNDIEKEKLALMKKRYAQDKKPSEKQMKNAPFQPPKIEENADAKFNDLYNSLIEAQYVYNKENVNELYEKNTADDNYFGEYDPIKGAASDTRDLEINKVGVHTQAYVKNYNEFHALVNEKDEYGFNKYDLSNLQTIDVPLTKSMLDANLKEGQTYQDLSYMWYGHDSGNKDYYQEAALTESSTEENKQYVFVKDEATGEEVMVDVDGNPMRAFKNRGGIEGGRGRVEPVALRNEDGTIRYAYQDLMDEVVDPAKFSFSDKNVPQYDGQNFYEYFSLGKFDKSKLSDQALNIPGISHFADQLSYDSLLLDQPNETSPNKYLTNEAVSDLRQQAMKMATFRDNFNSFQDMRMNKAIEEAAERMYRDANPNGQMPEGFTRVFLQMVKEGDGDLGKLSSNESFSDYNVKYQWGEKKGQRIENARDVVAEMVLNDFMTGYAQFDQGSAPQGTVPATFKWNENKGSRSSILGNTVGVQEFRLESRDQLKGQDVTFGTHNFVNVGNERLLRNKDDVGFVFSGEEFSRDLLNGVSGKVNAGAIVAIAVDKRTGEIIKYDTDAYQGRPEDMQNSRSSFVFDSQEQADNAIIIPALFGKFTPRDEDKLKKNIQAKITDDGAIMVNGQPLRSQDMDVILSNVKNADMFFPLNNRVSTDEDYKNYIDYIDGINETGIFYLDESGTKRKKGDEITSDAVFDFTFGGNVG